jgi:hypothetical protein
MEHKPDIWTAIGYYGIIYLIFLIFMLVGYPLAQQYAKPIAALIFPINGHNSLLYNALVMTGMYWGMVGAYTFINRGKGGSGGK